MIDTIHIDDLSHHIADHITTRLIPQAHSNSVRFTLGVASAVIPRLLVSYMSNPMVRATGIIGDDATTVYIRPLRDALLAGVSASGGLEIPMPFGDAIRITQSDIESLISSIPHHEQPTNITHTYQRNATQSTDR